MRDGARFELWFGDGVTFSLLPQLTHAWRRRGSLHRVPTPGRNVKVSVFGAYRWPDGPFVFSQGPRGVNTDLFLDLLRQLGRHAQRVRRVVVLVLDNGSAQTSKRSRAAINALIPRVLIFDLPSYASEQLNDIENLWTHLKEDYFSKMLVEEREAFPEAVRALLRRLRRRGELRSFLMPRSHGKRLM